MLTCAVLFGISFFATSQMRSSEEEPADESAEVEATAKDTSSDEDGPPLGMVKAMPVSLRPDNAVTVEAVLQMSDSIKKMEQQLAQRETRVAKKEQRVNLMLEDLMTEQDELRAFTEGIDAKIEMLSQLSNDVQTKLDTLEAKKSELEKLEKSTGTDEESKQQQFDDKVNTIKGWFANLQPEQAADYLKEFANNGKLEFAASLLQRLPDRQKSKVLGAMSDPVLVDQLIDALKVKPKAN